MSSHRSNIDERAISRNDDLRRQPSRASRTSQASGPERMDADRIRASARVPSRVATAAPSEVPIEPPRAASEALSQVATAALPEAPQHVEPPPISSPIARRRTSRNSMPGGPPFEFSVINPTIDHAHPSVTIEDVHDPEEPTIIAMGAGPSTNPQQLPEPGDDSQANMPSYGYLSRQFPEAPPHIYGDRRRRLHPLTGHVRGEPIGIVRHIQGTPPEIIRQPVGQQGAYMVGPASRLASAASSVSGDWEGIRRSPPHRQIESAASQSTLRSVDPLPEYEGQPQAIPLMGNANAGMDFAQRLLNMEHNLRGEIQHNTLSIPVIRNDVLRIIHTSTENARRIAEVEQTIERHQDLQRETHDNVTLTNGNVTRLRNTQNEILRDTQLTVARLEQIQETQDRHTQNLNTIQDIIHGFEARFEYLNEILQVIEERAPRAVTPALSIRSGEIIHHTPSFEGVVHSPIRQRSPLAEEEPRAPKSARLKEPEKYEKGENAQTFLTKLELFFNDSPNRAYFQIDDNRIIRLLTLMKGRAEAWSSTLLAKWGRGDRLNPLSSYADLRRSFLVYFDTPIKADKALDQIHRLTQTNSAQQYATKFKEYAQELEWNDAALIGLFKKGLKPEVRMELLKAEANPATHQYMLENWIEFAIRMDEVMFQGKDRERKAITGKAASTTSTNTSQGPRVPEEEIKRRKEKNLCIKCGKAGHRVRACRSTKWIGPGETRPESGKQAAIVEESTTSDSEKE